MKQTITTNTNNHLGILLALLFVFIETGSILHAQRDTYLVINLLKNTYRFQDSKPDLSFDECRTTELWFRKIPKGIFTMGAEEYEEGQDVNFPETKHGVEITKDYYISIFECTQKQWELVMGDNPSVFSGDTRPVENISYSMIRDNSWPENGHNFSNDSFMRKLYEKTKLIFDLPTEAEWEYACRAGSRTPYNSTGAGNSSADQDAIMAQSGRYVGNRDDARGGFSQHTEVGHYTPNKWGLYDMHGNVREWCLDWYDAYDKDLIYDPSGPQTGTKRIVRGGNWMDNAATCRSAQRKICSPANSHGGLGFRIVCHPVPNKPSVVVNENTSKTPTHFDSLYLVIDLATGKCEGRSTRPNLMDDHCRTTQIWLRRIIVYSFKMGSPKGEIGRDPDDEKQHDVTLSNKFYIGIFECTQAQWEMVMGKGHNPSKYKGAMRPVEHVSYDDIRGASSDKGGGWPSCNHSVDDYSFIGKLRSLTGLQEIDLPTEAQWEYACRSNAKQPIAPMDGVGRFIGNQDDKKGECQEHTIVGQYVPNEWELYDMRGNVAEWCLDWHAEYTEKIVKDPQGPQSGKERILRGGSWRMDRDGCRPASRNFSRPSSKSAEYGFRICLPILNK